MPEVARCQVSGMGRDGLDPAWLCQGIRYTVTHFYRMVFRLQKKRSKVLSGWVRGKLASGAERANLRKKAPRTGCCCQGEV